MDQLVNELSFSCCYPDVEKAQKGMEDFIALSQEMVKVGFLKDIKTTSDFRNRFIANDYTVYQWSIDKNVSSDLRLYFLSNATKAPYVEGLVDAAEVERELACESCFKGERALGLGLAYFWDSPVLCLSGDNRFVDPIEIDLTLLSGDEEITRLRPQICCLKTVGSIPPRIEWLRARIHRTLQNGNRIFAERERFFPHLVFCDRAREQIIRLVGSEQHFHEVVRHLFVIEEAVTFWKSGPFTLPGISYSPESELTLKNTDCKAQRTITCPDGVTRLFSLHTKIWSANQRIHYFPDLENRRVYIGHVGEHLKTMKYS